MDNHFDQSQSLFSSQFFNDLDPISTPAYTQVPVQHNSKRLDQVFSERFHKNSLIQPKHQENETNSKRMSKFMVPVAKSSSEDVGIDNILDSQSQFFPGNLLASSSLPRDVKSKCFQIPLSQKSQFTNEVFPSRKQTKETELSSENVNKIEDFINKYNGTSGQKINTVTNSFIPKPSSNFKSPIQKLNTQTTKPRIIQETPRLDRFSSYDDVKNSMENDLILDSDDEGKGPIYGPTLQTPRRMSLPPIETPGGTKKNGIQLRSVEEIPFRYRTIFDGIPYFNIVQSKIFDDALYTDQPLVVCAPTGSGKTIIFELAITRLLIKNEELLSSGKRVQKHKPKIVYMAPIKALCSERHEEWSRKFHSVGLECQELTGDSDVDGYWQLQKADIILTTPEKWDSMTRRWRDNTSLVRQVSLFLIDEVHLLNDEERGATMEAVVSRMKTVQTSISSVRSSDDSGLRFVAVSATIPNTDDIAEWLGSTKKPAISFDMDDSYRPVTLRKVVLGYPWSSNSSQFKFDINLNYKLGSVIQTYSDNKPTLVFCSTRKSAEQASTILAKDMLFVNDADHKQILINTANLIRNTRLRDMLQRGVGYHHAGLDSHDRHLVEELFTRGDLLVLVSTSTLAMGVNLPAHLVVIKSTCHYVRGMFEEYTQSEILQMIGRAGRPQFDTSATAVIMTKNQSRDLYHNVVNGSHKIESSLHKHLIEHLNAEIVLTTVHDVTIALEWIRSTFLYTRVLKNPTYYGYAKSITKDEAEKRLHELCMHNLDSLAAVNLVSIDDKLRLMSSEPGKLMARYFIAFETIKKFGTLSGQENLGEMVEIMSGCREFQEITLRMNERTNLNKMNKDKNRVTIRFPMTGRIKTTQMKVNCLIQATLGCINVQDFTLSQDVTRIFRNAMRVSRCLVELLLLKDNNFKSLYCATLLSKCIKAKLWENSRYITKQLPSIGPTLSTALANAGICSFAKLEATDPREVELIVNRHPPFGNHLHEAVKYLPKYTVHVEQVEDLELSERESKEAYFRVHLQGKRFAADTCDITVQVFLSNAEDLQEKKTAGKKHSWILLLGDADNRTVLKQRLSDSQLLTTDGNTWKRTLTIQRASKGDEISVNLISQEWVGLDVESTYSPYYLGPRRMTATATGVKNHTIAMESKYFDTKKKPCRHTCTNKRTCGHDCCKIPGDANHGFVENYADVVKGRGGGLVKTPRVGKDASSVDYLQKYKYDPKAKYSHSFHSNQVVPSTPNLSRSKGWENLDSFCDFQQNEEDLEMLEKLTAFEREQSYYDDQINLGSRIRYHEGVSEDKGNSNVNERNISASQQLWTEKGASQCIPCCIDLTEPELQHISPCKAKQGLKDTSHNSRINDPRGDSAKENKTDLALGTPSRMGKVFAWKSSTGQKSNLFPCSSATNVFTKSSTSTSLNRHTKPTQISHAGNRNNPIDLNPPASSHSLTSPYTSGYQSCDMNRASSSNASFGQPPSSNSEHSSTTNRFASFEQHSELNDQANVMRSFCPPDVAKRRSVQDFQSQLWEEAPSTAYPPYLLNCEKRVTFQDESSLPLHDSLEDREVSINCDFTLEDDDLMMEACLQAEDQPHALEVAPGHDMSPADPSTFPSSIKVLSQHRKRPLCQGESPQTQPLKKQLTQFFNKSSCQPPVSTNKTKDIADAERMFDSIFDGIF